MSSKALFLTSRCVIVSRPPSASASALMPSTIWVPLPIASTPQRTLCDRSIHESFWLTAIPAASASAPLGPMEFPARFSSSSEGLMARAAAMARMPVTSFPLLVRLLSDKSRHTKPERAIPSAMALAPHGPILFALRSSSRIDLLEATPSEIANAPAGPRKFRYRFSSIKEELLLMQSAMILLPSAPNRFTDRSSRVSKLLSAMAEATDWRPERSRPKLVSLFLDRSIEVSEPQTRIARASAMLGRGPPNDCAKLREVIDCARSSCACGAFIRANASLRSSSAWSARTRDICSASINRNA
mmetsp:Transcript_16202/g.26993  ORF Transcript_16202/g.26993 Transcript_16202/m.26993 type:complete len:300 (-) Transcript_16202:236-1135(-)